MLYDDVLAALATVRDPELDEPLTELGFVSACEVDAAGGVTVRLRLPTFFCAAEFRLPDGRRRLRRGECRARRPPALRYCSTTTSRPIRSTAAWLRAQVSVTSFGALAPASSTICARSSCARRCSPAPTGCAGRWRCGRTPEQVVALRLGDAPDTFDRERLRASRAELGLPAGDDDPLLVDPVTGDRVDADALSPHLGRARLTRISLEANGGICRGMLRERYATAGIGEKEEQQ